MNKHELDKAKVNVTISLYEEDVSFIRDYFKVSLSYICRELLNKEVMMLKYYEDLKEDKEEVLE